MLADKDFLPFWLENQSDESYHSDLSAVNSSSLRLMLDSAASFKATFIDRTRSPEKQAKRFGKIFHKAMLEGENFAESSYAVMPEWADENGEALNKRKKVYQDKKKEWLAENAGKAIVEQAELDRIKGMVDSVLCHPDAILALEYAATEISGYYKDPKTGIMCRIRPDIYAYRMNHLSDVKTTRSCRKEDFERDIYEHGYYFQSAMYREGIFRITGKLPDICSYIAVEKEAPYECAVYELNEQALDLGYKRYRQALDKLKQCIDSGGYPKYQEEAEPIGIPIWAQKKERIYDRYQAHDRNI